MVVSDPKRPDEAVEAGWSDVHDPWQRTLSMAVQLHTLETRVEELAKDLEEAEMGARCRSCRAYALQHVQTRGPYNGNMMEEQWCCASCGFQESRIYATRDDQSRISARES